MSFEVTDVLALIENPEWPPDHWRVIRPFTRLRQTGIDARWAWGDDKQHLRTDPESTILVVPRQTGTDEAAIDAWFRERRPCVRAIVADADDLIFDEDPMIEHLQLANFTQGRTVDQLRREAQMARYFASKCDGVTVSSPALVDAVKRFTDKPVVLVGNAIDTRWFRAQMAHRPGWSERLTIGWSGGRRPERDILPMAEAWGRISKRYPEVRFVVAAAVVPDAFYRFVEDDTKIIRLPFMSLHDYPAVYQVDIGCCSVADTVFSRAKTSIKCWEYAVAGARVIGTPTLYGDCCLDGTTRGHLATTTDEWEYYLDVSIRAHREGVRGDPQLLAHVEQHHSLDSQLHRWPAAWAEIIESTSRRAAA